MIKEIEELLIKAKGNDKEALEAMLFLAKIYTNGMYGEEKNLEKAEFWSNKAKELEQKLLKNVPTSPNIHNTFNTPNTPNTSKEKSKFNNNFSDRFRNLQFVNTSNINNTTNVNNKTNSKQINVENSNTTIEESRTFDFDADEINKKLKNIFFKREVTEETEINKIKKRISTYSNSVPNHDLKDLGDKVNIVSVLELPSYKIVLNSHYEIRKLKDGTLPYKGEQIPKKLLNREDIDIWSFDTQQISSIKDFEEKENAFTIVASQEVNRCSYCHGNGENICNECHGHGEIRCSECGGRGEKRCSSCDGHGYKINSEGRRSSCWTCGGTGYIKCSYCDNGYVSCYSCHGNGRVTCSICDGQGEVINFLYIEDVFKTKKIIEIINNEQYPKTLITNKTEKEENNEEVENNNILTPEDKILRDKYPLEYVKYIDKIKELEDDIILIDKLSKLPIGSKELEQVYILGNDENNKVIYNLMMNNNGCKNFTPEELDTIHFNGINYINKKKQEEEKQLNFLEEIGFEGFYHGWTENKRKKNGIKKSEDNTNKTCDNILFKKQKESIVLDFKNNFIPETILNSLDDENAPLKKVFNKIIDSSKNIPDFGILNKDYKILKQNIIISKVNAICVKYKYKDREYSIWLYGENYSEIYLEKSPITEIYDEYIEKSENLLEQKQYLKALEVIDKVCAMKIEGRYAHQLKNTIISKIRGQYIWGGFFGGLFLFPAIFLLIIDWFYGLQEWLYPTVGSIFVSAGVSIIIGCTIGFLLAYIHSISIKKTEVRYLLPLIYSIFISIIIIFSCIYINGKDYYIDCFYYRTRKYDKVLQRNSNNEFKILSQSKILEKAFNEFKHNKTNENLKKAKDELFLYYEIRKKLQDNLKDIEKRKSIKTESEKRILQEINFDDKDLFSEAIENWKSEKIKTANSILQKIKKPGGIYSFEGYIAAELVEAEITASKTNKTNKKKK